MVFRRYLLLRHFPPKTFAHLYPAPQESSSLHAIMELRDVYKVSHLSSLEKKQMYKNVCCHNYIYYGLPVQYLPCLPSNLPYWQGLKEYLMLCKQSLFVRHSIMINKTQLCTVWYSNYKYTATARMTSNCKLTRSFWHRSFFAFWYSGRHHQ